MGRKVMADVAPRTYAFGVHLWKPGHVMYVCPTSLRPLFKYRRRHVYADEVDVDHIAAALQRYVEELFGENFTSSVDCLEDGRLKLTLGSVRRDR